MHTMNLWPVLNRLDIPLAQKAVLAFLADGADPDGKTYWTQKRLAEEMNISRETVNRAIKAAEDHGLLAKTERSRNGSQVIYNYTFAPETIPDTKTVTRDTNPVTRRYQSSHSGDTILVTQNHSINPPENPDSETILVTRNLGELRKTMKREQVYDEKTGRVKEVISPGKSMNGVAA